MNEEEVKKLLEEALNKKQEENNIKFKKFEDELVSKDKTIKEFKDLINTSFQNKSKEEEVVAEYKSSFLKNKEQSIKESNNE